MKQRGLFAGTLLLLAASATLASIVWWATGRPVGLILVFALTLGWGIWLMALLPRWRIIPTLLAPGLMLVGAAALLWSEETQAGRLIYVGGVCVLAAWDLSLFLSRLRDAAVIQAEAGLIAAHVGRLGGVLGLALLIGLFGPGLVPLPFAFTRTLLLAILLIASITWLLRRLP